MTELDPSDDLHRIAGLAETSARPLPADQVRALGDRRRGRRGLVTAGITLVTLLLVGGAVFAGLMLFRGSGQLAGPPIGATPSGAASSPGSSPTASTPPVRATASATVSAAAASTVSKPSSRTTSSLRESTSATSTFAQPRMRSHCAASAPIGPAPHRAAQRPRPGRAASRRGPAR